MADEDTSSTPPPVTEPVATPQEATPAPTEPEVVPSEAIEVPPVEAQTAQPETQTAQMGRNEPIGSESAPVDGPLPATSEPLPEQKPAAQPSAPVSVVSPIVNLGRDVLAKARATIQSRKKIKLEKIMTELEKKGKVTNDEVEKLLHVSDATATRYLSALEKEGKIKQVGKTGIGVVYTKV